MDEEAFYGEADLAGICECYEKWGGDVSGLPEQRLEVGGCMMRKWESKEEDGRTSHG